MESKTDQVLKKRNAKLKKELAAKKRELEIEASLDKVRSRSMAMHKTDELEDVSAVLYKQLRKLGFQFVSCGFVIVMEKEGLHSVWNYDFKKGQLSHFQMTLKGDKVLAERHEAWKKGTPVFLQETKGKTLNKNLSNGIPEEFKSEKDLASRFNIPDPCYFCFANFSKGYLHVLGKSRLPKDQQDILARFSRVFEQAYTRFLDLQKAEAQAREAQIEAALERVRAASMAMHKSEELRELVFEFYKQIHPFGFAKWGFEIKIANEDKSGFYCWISPPGARIQPEGFNIPTLDHWVLKKYSSVFEKQLPIATIEVSGDDKKRLGVLLLEKSDMKHLPQEVKTNIMDTDYVHFSVASMRFGLLKAVDIEPVPEKDINILQRFAKVFEQTYTRFLDLQKAEAQAREAQIEAALERVRATSMAMHKSEELLNVARTFLLQIDVLEIHVITCSINIVNPETKNFITYGANIIKNSEGLSVDQMPQLNIDDFGFLKEVWEKFTKTGTPVFSIELRGKYLRELLDTWKTTNYSGLKNKKILQNPKVLFIDGVHFNQYSSIATIALNPLSEHELSILQRLTKSFSMSYTRFLDLQKAETQAREAEIEVALERVRSRMMAMHKTDELHEVLGSIFTQLQSLGLDAPGSSLIIYNQELAAEHWMTGFSGGQFPESYKIPYNEHPYFTDLLQAWQNGVPFQEFFFEGDLKLEYGKWCLEYSDFKRMPPEFKKEMVNPERMVISDAFNKYGMIEILGPEPLPEESIGVLKRFSKVFEQTYTRFLDLQKAEAQAREAKIEAALERVRSASLAMHKSDDLESVVVTLFDKLIELGIPSYDAVFIILFNRELKSFEMWVATRFLSQPTKVKMPFDKSLAENRIIKDLWNVLKTGKSILNHTYTGKPKNDYFRFMAEHNDFSDELKQLHQETEKWTVSFIGEKNSIAGFDSWSGQKTSEENFQILKRFSRVFEQTYTRFLDLQKAEAQAREAEIQLALERIRARSMAMQSSEELREVVQVMYDQVAKLQISKWGCFLMIFDKVKKNIQGWYSDIVSGAYPRPFDFDNQDHEVVQKWWQFWESDKEILSIHLEDEEKLDFLRYLFTKTEFKNIPDEVKTAMIKEPEVYLEYTNMESGIIEFIDIEPFPEESISVIKRITSAFEQSYTRFLDLKKAEAQAREAEIELGLERVRARTMAMHKSEELGDVAVLLYKELTSLGMTPFFNCGYVEIDEENNIQHCWFTTADGKFLEPFHLPLTGETNFDNRYENWKKRVPVFHQVVGGESLKKHMEFLFPVLGSKEVEEIIRNQFPDPTIFYCGNFSNGYLSIVTGTPLNEDDENLLAKFTNVFEMTYKRFLDLQKAEAQAREAEIQLALERVRARTMAMHKSEELAEVSAVLFQQLNVLGNSPERLNIGIVNEEKRIVEYWATDQNGQQIDHKFNATIEEPTTIAKVYAGWKENKKSMVLDLTGDELKRWMHYLLNELKMPFKEELIHDRRVHSVAFFSHGMLLVSTPEPLSAEALNLLERFAEVFNLTYRRFLDLQKAEAQAREAQIEAALERVRSRTMAMHRSDELSEAATLLYQQLSLLGINQFFSCGYVIVDEASHKQYGWMTNFEGSFVDKFTLPLTGEPVFDERFKSWKKKVSVFHQTVGGERLKKHIEFAIPTLESKGIEELVRTQFRDPTVFYCFNFTFGYLHLISDDLIPKEQEALLIRFTNVFEMTYRRFLDLQKAEAQAREAQIEAALERVRSRSIAMRKSEEIADIAGKIFSELRQLDIASSRVLIWTFNDTEKYTTWWSANPEVESTAESYRIDYNENPVFINYLQAWQQRIPIHLYTLEGDTQKAWVDHLFEHTEMSRLPMAVKKGIREEGAIYTVSAISDYGLMLSGSTDPWSQANIDIIQRFGRVFQQSYTRYLDIQKAEVQAREAQIEAALERVRGRAMAMQKSHELKDVVNIMIQNLQELGLQVLLCEIVLFEINFKSWKSWLYIPSGSDFINFEFAGPYFDHPFTKHQKEAYQRGGKYTTYVLEGEDKKHFDELFHKHMSGPNLSKMEAIVYPIPRTVFSLAYLTQGTILVAGEAPLSEEGAAILQRFAKVVDLTYTRVEDLQKAEQRSVDAIRQSSLDRIRANIASMRKVSDLDRITPLIWNELTILGIPFIRCGVFIMDDEQQMTHTFLSTPDGKAIAAFHIPYNTPGHISNVLQNWKEGKNYLDHWDENAFTEFAHTLVDQGALSSPEEYLKTLPPGGFYLHFLPFLQGMFYVGNTTQLNDEAINLIQSVADAFSTAYARYEDFNKLEAAKKQVDHTLNELQATQKQLIQSEKMASLGELTAGIAHEIQNPLNFVNNFSEVNKEMLEELKEERSKPESERDEKTEDEIITDLIANEEKINHHGKRADAIVKSMLEHSRSSTGVKEPTDINKLADEYLRLAYHGLRAKDKNFNAEMKVDFDESIGKINIIPQDIGRVLLNLFNNAFYAVSQQKSKNSVSYQPTVSVTTKKTENSVTITVKDNGGGIPEKIKEKIFQPFFTTKPTGSGTGLGLSLSYDIVKAHRGEIKVETKEGEGTTFIINLPTI